MVLAASHCSLSRTSYRFAISYTAVPIGPRNFQQYQTSKHKILPSKTILRWTAQPAPTMQVYIDVANYIIHIQRPNSFLGDKWLIPKVIGHFLLMLIFNSISNTILTFWSEALLAALPLWASLMPTLNRYHSITIKQFGSCFLNKTLVTEDK